MLKWGKVSCKTEKKKENHKSLQPTEKKKKLQNYKIEKQRQRQTKTRCKGDR